MAARHAAIENSKPRSAGRYSGATGILRQIAAGKTGKVFMSPVSIDPLYRPKITCARPVFDELKNLRGAIVLDASLMPLQEILAGLRVGSNGRAISPIPQIKKNFSGAFAKRDVGYICDLSEDL